MQTLATQYRPSSFQEMVGQKATSAILQRMVEEDKVPSGLLFSGVRGSGKTTAARILASSVGAGEVIEIDAASHGSVQDVRDLLDVLKVSSGGLKRVIIYDEAHSMSKEAFNALLKTLEEPPASVSFILVTTEPHKIPETVKSRLMEFEFRKVSATQITERIAQVTRSENILMTKSLAILLGERADGSVRDGLMLLDQCRRAGISTKDEFLSLVGESDEAPTLVRAMLTGDHAHIFQVLEEVSLKVNDPYRLSDAIVGVLKDVLILRAGGTLDMPDEAVAIRKEIASHLEPDRVLAALKMVWDLKTKARQAEEPRSNLNLVVVLVTEVFTRGRSATLKPPTEAPRRVSIDEL